MPAISDLTNKKNEEKTEYYKCLYLELVFLLRNSNIYFKPISSDFFVPESNFRYKFTALWNTLTIHEKYFLFDLAQYVIVNTVDQRVIENLLNKGLIKWHQEKLTIFHSLFKEFVITEGKNEIMQFEKSSKEESRWKNLELPISIGIVGLAAFLFFTQREVFNTFQTLIVSLTATLPLLPRIFTVFANSKVKDN